MEIATLKGEPRTGTGTRLTRKLRAMDRLPAIIYGHGEPPESISFSQHDVEVALGHGVRMLAVELGSTTNQYLIKEVQYDHLGATPIHLDLARVDMDERVTVRVGIELRGVPKGISAGGLLDQLLPELEISCRVADIPHTLHPLVNELDLEESLLVKDLELPPGVVAVTDPEERVATVRTLATAREPEVTEEVEGETEEPERIGRVRKEEEAKTQGES